MRNRNPKRRAGANSTESIAGRFKYVHCPSDACRRKRRCLAKRKKQSCKYRDPKPDWTPDDSEKLASLRRCIERVLAERERAAARRIAAGKPIDGDISTPEEDEAYFHEELSRMFGPD